METHDHDVLSSNPSSFQIIFLQNFVVVYKGPTINEKETGNFPFLNYPGIEVTLRRLFATTFLPITKGQLKIVNILEMDVNSNHWG